MIVEIGLVGFGFGLGVLVTSIQGRIRERDMLDRISWRNPEDYYFMKYQREAAAKAKKTFEFPKFGMLQKKKNEPPGIPIDPDRITKHIENSIAAKEDGIKNYAAYKDGVEQMAKAGVSNP